VRSENWIIFSLNSEIDASPGSPQADWVETTLAANPEMCVGAFYHKPAFSSVPREKSDDARSLFALMANAGARFVLNGHNHFYERSKPMDAVGAPANFGTTQFIAGADGRITSREIAREPVANQLITGTAGLLQLDISADTVVWRYLTDERANPADAGTISCGNRLAQPRDSLQTPKITHL